MATLTAITLAKFDALFPDETACKQYLRARRWPTQVACPRCGDTKVYELKARPWHWLCQSEQCRRVSSGGYRFSLYVGTLFERTKYPLLMWFKALCCILASHEVSASQMPHMLGSADRTAENISQRLRAGMADPEFVMLMGIGELDDLTVHGRR